MPSRPRYNYPLLYRVGDPVRVRDADPPVMATVAALGTGRVKVSYTASDGMVATRRVAVPSLEQATISQTMKDL